MALHQARPLEVGNQKIRCPPSPALPDAPHLCVNDADRRRAFGLGGKIIGGFICKPKDYKSLGKSVVNLLQDDVLRKRMGENARKKVVDNFDNFDKTYINIFMKNKNSRKRTLKRLYYIHKKQD